MNFTVTSQLPEDATETYSTTRKTSSFGLFGDVHGPNSSLTSSKPTSKYSQKKKNVNNKGGYKLFL